MRSSRNAALMRGMSSSCANARALSRMRRSSSRKRSSRSSGSRQSNTAFSAAFARSRTGAVVIELLLGWRRIGRERYSSGMPGEREIIFEFVRVGSAMKVIAVDAESGLEVTIVGDPAAGEAELKRLARQKLEYVRAKGRG